VALGAVKRVVLVGYGTRPVFGHITGVFGSQRWKLDFVYSKFRPIKISARATVSLLGVGILFANAISGKPQMTAFNGRGFITQMCDTPCWDCIYVDST
jgi:hypothetical protein